MDVFKYDDKHLKDRNEIPFASEFYAVSDDGLLIFDIADADPESPGNGDAVAVVLDKLAVRELITALERFLNG